MDNWDYCWGHLWQGHSCKGDSRALQLCWVLTHGQKPCTPSAFWRAWTERAYSSHSSVWGAVWGQLEEKCTSAPCLLQELNQTGGGLGGRSGLSGVPQHCLMLRWRKLSWAWGRALQKVSPSLHRPNPRPFTSNGWNLLKAETRLNVSGKLKNTPMYCPFAGFHNLSAPALGIVLTMENIGW